MSGSTITPSSSELVKELRFRAVGVRSEGAQFLAILLERAANELERLSSSVGVGEEPLKAAGAEELKAGDWVVYDLKIGQLRECNYSPGNLEFSDGFICTSGRRLVDACRHLTLRTKVITQSMDGLYDRLRQIDGESGFNYPDISQYFSGLALDAIDGDEKAERAAYDKAQKFAQAACDYQRVIDGIRLFRPK